MEVHDAGIVRIRGRGQPGAPFHLEVIAEGLETEAQNAVLAEAGVDWAQGYLHQRLAGPARILALRGTWINEWDGVEASTVV